MKRLVTACLAVAMLVVAASASQAALVSRSNPYGSFNSGVNYGAQQWEAHHGHHTHGLFRR